MADISPLQLTGERPTNRSSNVRGSVGMKVLGWSIENVSGSQHDGICETIRLLVKPSCNLSVHFLCNFLFLVSLLPSSPSSSVAVFFLCEPKVIFTHARTHQVQLDLQPFPRRC